MSSQVLAGNAYTQLLSLVDDGFRQNALNPTGVYSMAKRLREPAELTESMQRLWHTCFSITDMASARTSARALLVEVLSHTAVPLAKLTRETSALQDHISDAVRRRLRSSQAEHQPSQTSRSRAARSSGSRAAPRLSAELQREFDAILSDPQCDTSSAQLAVEAYERRYGKNLTRPQIGLLRGYLQECTEARSA